MERAIAVVVTYNRLSLLKECISALRNQTRKLDAILVVNNGSADGTENWLLAQEDIYFITQENKGSAGGFETGISWAYNEGYSWIWCMDDDGYPKEDAIENLLKHETNERSLMNCAVINKKDKKSFVWKTAHYKNIDEVDVDIIKNVGHPFNGTLIHQSIVAKVGVPNSSLFLWGDETEYYYRIVKQHRIPIYTVASSIHYHPAAAFNYRYDWDFSSSWKLYFYVRNRLHVQKAKFTNRLTAFIHYLCFMAAFTGIILVYQKTEKRKKFNMFMLSAKDAFRNDFSETPATILNKITLAEAKGHKSQLTFRGLWQLFFTPGNSATKAATS